jgi:hypothetical protein
MDANDMCTANNDALQYKVLFVLSDASAVYLKRTLSALQPYAQAQLVCSLVWFGR